MSVYLKFLRLFLVLMMGIFFLVGSGGGGSSDSGDDSPTADNREPPASMNDTISPSVPKLVSATSVSKSKVLLEWFISTDNKTKKSEIIYELHASKAKDFQPNSSTLKKTIVGTDNGVVDSLVLDTEYNFRVVAKDKAGNSGWSNILSAHTKKVNDVLGNNNIIHAHSSQIKILNNEALELNSSVKLKIGDIIENTEEGYLKKIVSFEKKSGKTIVKVKEAALNDVYETLNFNTSIKLVNFEKKNKYKSLSAGANQKKWKSGLTLTSNSLNSRKVISSSEVISSSGDYMYAKIPKYTIADVTDSIKIPITLRHIKMFREIEVCENNTSKDYSFWAIGCSKKIVKYKNVIKAIDIHNFRHTGNKKNYSKMKIDGRYVIWNPKESDIPDDGMPYEFDIVVTTAPDRTDGHYFHEKHEESIVLYNIQIFLNKGKYQQEIKDKSIIVKSDKMSIENKISINFQPELNIDAKISSGFLQNAKIELEGNINLEQILTTYASSKTTLSKYKEGAIFKVDFLKVIPTTVPIVLSGTMKLDLAIDASTNAEINVKEKFKNIYKIKVGLNYNKETGNWEPIRKSTNSFSFTLDGKAESKVNLKVTIVPDLDIEIYKCAAARIRLLPYLYSNLSVNGSFNFREDTDNFRDIEESYSFDKLEVGGGLDMTLFAGAVWDYNILKWPKDSIRADFDTHKKISPIRKTKFMGIPKLNISYDINKKHPKDSKAIYLKANVENILNPFYSKWKLGKEYYITFKKWSKKEVVMDNSAFISEGKNQNEFWLHLSSTGEKEYNVKLSGYSSLGRYINQNIYTKIVLKDEDNDGILDYWENKFNISDPNIDSDGDGFTNLEEFQNGTNPRDGFHDTDLEIFNDTLQQYVENKERNDETLIRIKEPIYSEDEITFGDLDGDGIEEWVVTYGWEGSQGVHAETINLLIFKKTDEGFELLAEESVDRGMYNIRIEEQEIIANQTVHLDGDAMCCPSGEVEIKYSLKWNEQSNKWDLIKLTNTTGSIKLPTTTIWKGTYTCSQGLTGMTLKIDRKNESEVDAIFSFYAVASNPNVPSGSITMRGEYVDDLALDLTHASWIKRPNGYVFVDLSGTFDASFNSYSGSVNSSDSGCTTFSLKRSPKSRTDENNISRTTKVKKTGQVKSYDQYGNEVTDGSIKDDGYYQKGVTPSYTRDDEKEIVTDNITKLQWQDNEEARTVTKNWEDAKSYCSELTLGGYSNWRLPTIVELQSIVVDGNESLFIDTATFVNYYTYSLYWSSTTYVNYTNLAWAVIFYSGDTGKGNKSSSAVRVRCVRAGQ